MSEPKILWLDLETTGLNPLSDEILEVAAIYTDFDFNTINTMSLAVRHPQSKLDSMTVWCKDVHGGSGLTQECLDSEYSLVDAERTLLNMIQDDKPNLAGNSIHFDRSFIMVHMPELYEKLHHRIIDVSTLNVLADQWGKSEFHLPKAEAHRALDDTRESIRQAKIYKSALFGGKQ
jgi:oligoribonuclease